MDKITAHTKLSKVKALVREGKIRFTRTALTGSASLGMDANDMTATIMSLSAQDFYKSMTTYADHSVWQDVYRPQTHFGHIYLKLTVIEDVLVVSFKEL